MLCFFFPIGSYSLNIDLLSDIISVNSIRYVPVSCYPNASTHRIIQIHRTHRNHPTLTQRSVTDGLWSLQMHFLCVMKRFHLKWISYQYVKVRRFQRKMHRLTSLGRKSYLVILGLNIGTKKSYWCIEKRVYFMLRRILKFQMMTQTMGKAEKDGMQEHLRLVKASLDQEDSRAIPPPTLPHLPQHC